MASRLVDLIDTLARQLIDILPVERCTDIGYQLERPRLSCDSTGRNEDRTRDQDRVEVFKSNFPVSLQIIDRGDSVSVVGMKEFEQNVHGGQDVFLFFGCVLFSRKFISISGERRQKGQEHFWFKLVQTSAGK